MEILDSIEDFKPQDREIALTIGNFDGVHLGHRSIFDALCTKNMHKVLFTFSNHPMQVLKKGDLSRLTTLEHRLDLFAKLGIDTAIVIPFTPLFSKQSAEQFICLLKKHLNFSYLVLGYDATIGYDRNTDLSLLATQYQFHLDYLEPKKVQDEIISSSRIRDYIEKGELELASQLLGRTYSIMGKVQKGVGKGHALGFKTANLAVEGLCLPPMGVYAVRVKIKGKWVKGIANLGKAPTLHLNRSALLEVHLLDFSANLYTHILEVFFLNYIRKEKEFATVSALKEQIQKDLIYCNTLTGSCDESSDEFQ